MIKTGNEYIKELENFADEIAKEFKVAPYPHALPGGVASMCAELENSQYDHAKQWLEVRFGEPEIKEPWYPRHRKGSKVFCFRNQPQVFNTLDHVNLIQMYTRKDKRYVLLSWM